MPNEIAKPDHRRRKLIFDGDGSQFLPDTGLPCHFCGIHQTPEDAMIFIRVREKLESGTREIGHVCPDCVARMFLQVERLNLWKYVTGQVMAAIKRLFKKRYVSKPESRPSVLARQALGSVPGPKLASKGLDKLLPPK